jgi:hypothetical protein
MRTLALWTGTAVVAAMASIAAAYAVTRLNDFRIGDLGGYLYAFAATPLAAVLAAAVLLAVLPRSLGNVARAGTTIGVVALASSLAHGYAMQHRAIGGWYVLPAGFDVSRQSVEQLRAAALDRNDELAGAALEELGRRGRAGADALLGVVEDVRRSAGTDYVDVWITIRAAELLAHQKDGRVLPLLEAMRHSQSRVFGTVGAAGIRTTESFPTRAIARSLLREDFGIDADADAVDGQGPRP